MSFPPLRYFKREEFGPEADRLDPMLLDRLDALRGLINSPIVVHVDGILAKRERTPNSQHPLGCAIDCHAPELSLIDFWLAAEAVPSFRGIGVYPHWNHPGVHVDIRLTNSRARWWQDAHGDYHPLTADALRQILGGV